jgi:hypothetical protein
MLPVSLDCFCCDFLRLVYPMLPVSLDSFEEKHNKNNQEKLAT